MRPRTVLVLSAAATVVAVAAGAGGCSKRVDERPTIVILTPADGGDTGASTFPVHVKITNFSLSLTTEGGNTPFVGHWELFLGDATQGFFSLGLRAAPAPWPARRGRGNPRRGARHDRRSGTGSQCPVR